MLTLASIRSCRIRSELTCVGFFLQTKVTLSKSAQEKLRRRRKEDKEHNHKEQQEVKDLEGKEEFPWERIRLSMSEPEKLTAESEDEALS